jgi:TolA-binding protein
VNKVPGLLAPLLATLAAADGGALGSWTANGARLELKDEGGKVVGRLAGEGGPCPLPAGSEVLRGTLLDDSISAQVRLCLVSRQCGATEETALAVLLVTRTLTGGVHTRSPCAHDVLALVLRRPGAAMAMSAPASNERLARSPPPRSPRARPVQKAFNTEIASQARLPTANVGRDEVPVGQIPGRPVGEKEHPPGYDPRDARKVGTPQGEAERLLVEGAALLQQGRFERARKLFRDAVDKDPQRAEAYNGVGVTFYARGDLDEALAWYKKSLEADPRFGDAYYNLACIYALQQHDDLAFRYLRMAALNRYSAREQMEADPDLGSLRASPEWAEIVAQMSTEQKPRP